MKKQIIITILLVFIAMVGQAQIKPEVSETVELMSILSRIAGFEEFSGNFAGQYSKDIDAWFSSYREHPTVGYYKDIRAKHGIGYDRVTNMAVHLETENGKVKLVGNRNELTDVWKSIDIDDFVNRLNKFYADTRFHEFFGQHRSFYNEFLTKYGTSVTPHIHTDWYTKFHNGTESGERFRLIIGFAYGSTNNGVYRQLAGKPREVFAVCGYYQNPVTGKLMFDLTLPLHEFNHSFVNPLLDKPENAKVMQEAGQRLLQISQAAMAAQAYNDWHIVINESLVRAALIVYLNEHGLDGPAMKLLEVETKRNGFLWMQDVVDALRHYSAHRDQYPTFNDFYPEIARRLSKYSLDESQKH